MADDRATEREFAPEEILDEILLSMIDGVGPRLSARLYERFGSVQAILDAPAAELETVEKIGPKISRQIASARKLYQPAELVELCQKSGIMILHRSDARYPRRLREIIDPPTILYVRGTIEPQDALAIAVVGTRGMSYYGRKQTERIAGELARAGFTIVSGLAAGVDGAAHDSALLAGGRTLAVLGSGVLKIFPSQHEKLAERVIERGALISEFHPFADPLSGNFPQRNRIVSGLSLGVLVVESPRRSGSLITARLATEQNREVFAVPGPVDVENSRGCHQLLRDGAKLVETADDILEELGPLPLPVPSHQKSPGEVRHPAEMKLNEREKAVLALIETTPISVDLIIERSHLAPSQLLAVITVLEAKRLIRRCEGNRVARF